MANNHPNKTPKLITLIFLLLLLHSLSADPTTNNHLLRRLPVESYCDDTLYPALCVSTLQNHQGKSLSDAVAATLDVAFREVEASMSKCTSFARSHPRPKWRKSRAIDVCIDLLDISADELRRAADDLKKANGTVSSRRYDDIRTLLSAVMTYQYTCLDEFELDDDKKFGDDFLEPRLTRVSDHVSNALSLLKKVAERSPASVRNAFAEEQMVYGVRENGFPRWLSATDTRQLAEVDNIKHDLVVAKDGSGNFDTVGEAVAAAPENSKKRFVIYIKAGTYKENVEVGRKQSNLMFVGDGIGKTVITACRSVHGGWRTFTSATVAVLGPGFIAKGISFENTAGPSAGQAVALRSSADLSAFYKCSFTAYQDTLNTHSGRQFFRNCDVYGTVDFIFGNSAAVFQNCNLYARLPAPGQGDVFTAQGRNNPNQNTGLSFINCNVAAAPDLAAHPSRVKTYLGRPWKLYSRTVFMKSKIGGLVDPAGWSPWSGASRGLDTLYYGEYENRGPGSSTRARVRWPGYHVISSSKEASHFTVRNFINHEGDWLTPTGIPFYPDLSPNKR